MGQRQILSVDTVLPLKLTILPLRNTPVYPGIFTPMMITDKSEIEIVNKALAGDGFLGLVLSKSEEFDINKLSDLYKVGTAAKIVRKINLPDGGINIFVSTLKRFTGKKFLNNSSPIIVAVNYLEDNL